MTETRIVRGIWRSWSEKLRSSERRLKEANREQERYEELQQAQ